MRENILRAADPALSTVHRLQDEERRGQELAVRAAELERQNRALTDQLATVRASLDRHQGELVRVRRAVTDMEREGRVLSARLVALEEDKADLARLCVAARILHGTLDTSEVLSAIREVVINLLGSEEFAVLEFDPERAELVPLATMGVDPDACRLPLGVGPVGHALRTGEPYFRDHDHDADRDAPVAVVPLRLAGRVAGVAVVFSLLPQKPGLVPFDHDLLDLLADHAAAALYATRLHSMLHGTRGGVAA